MNFIEVALQRLVFTGPFDTQWFVGMVIALIFVVLLVTLIWQDQKKKAK